ncbi:MAG: DUF1801 domain-containing protein [Paracoccaceae bacterium]
MKNVETTLAAIPKPNMQAEARILNDIFTQVTGWQPRMWGKKLFGYGQYHYTYESGRQGDFLATGFSPGAAKFSLHILPGYQDYTDITTRLGKFKRGKSCWYVNKLADIDLTVLPDLIRAGLADLEKTGWPIKHT